MAVHSLRLWNKLAYILVMQTRLSLYNLEIALCSCEGFGSLSSVHSRCPYWISIFRRQRSYRDAL